MSFSTFFLGRVPKCHYGDYDQHLYHQHTTMYFRLCCVPGAKGQGAWIDLLRIVVPMPIIQCLRRSYLKAEKSALLLRWSRSTTAVAERTKWSLSLLSMQNSRSEAYFCQGYSGFVPSHLHWTSCGTRSTFCPRLPAFRFDYAVLPAFEDPFILRRCPPPFWRPDEAIQTSVASHHETADAPRLWGSRTRGKGLEYGALGKSCA